MTHFLHLHGAVLLCVLSCPHTAHGHLDLPPVGISSLLQAQMLTVGAAVLSLYAFKDFGCATFCDGPEVGQRSPNLLKKARS